MRELRTHLSHSLLWFGSCLYFGVLGALEKKLFPPYGKSVELDILV